MSMSREVFGHTCVVILFFPSPTGYMLTNASEVFGHTVELFSLYSMTCSGNTKRVELSRCRLLVNMTNGVKLLYYRGNTKT